MICPICSRPEVHAFRPFCSRRCADIDLGRWLSDTYRIPDSAEAETDEKSGGPKGGGPH
jgi:uncharacterized protein